MENQRIEVIEQFLKSWKEKAQKFYQDIRDEYVAANKAYFNYIDNTPGKAQWQMRGTPEAKELDAKRKNILEKITSVEMREVIRYSFQNLEKILDREVNSKRKSLITRVEKVVGEINDANNLYVASNGEINGIVIGDLGKAQVRTIFAGGYNIQCLHYRVLVKEVK